MRVPEMWVDCHCHLSLSEVSLETAQAIVAEAKSAQITEFVLGGYDPNEWQRQKYLSAKISAKFYFSIGIHPWLVKMSDHQKVRGWLAKMPQQLGDAHFVGELGVDKGSAETKEDLNFQIEIFREQLAHAKKFQKPVMLHAIGHHDEIIRALKENQVLGYVHAFSGEWGLAKSYLDSGLKLSFDPRSLKKSGEVIRKISKDDFLIESDAPNKVTKSSVAVITVAEEIAKIRGENRDDILKQVSINLKKLVGEE